MTTTKLYDSEKVLEEAQQARKARQFESAESLYKRAIESRQQALGDDVSVARIMNDLGTLFVELGRFSEAAELFKNAITLLERIYYPGHASLSPMLENLADVYIKQGKYDEAEPVAARALEVNDKTLSGEHRCTLQSVHRLAMVQWKLGKLADAEKVLTKALKNVDSPLGPMEEFKFDLARLYLEQGKNAEAEKAYQEAIAGFEYRRNLPRLGDCLESYAEFLSKTDHKEESIKAKERAKKMREISKDWRHSKDIFPATLLRA